MASITCSTMAPDIPSPTIGTSVAGSARTCSTSSDAPKVLATLTAVSSVASESGLPSIRAKMDLGVISLLLQYGNWRIQVLADGSTGSSEPGTGFLKPFGILVNNHLGAGKSHQNCSLHLVGYLMRAAQRHVAIELEVELDKSGLARR